MRLIAWVVVELVTSAVALLIAATLVDGFDIDTLAFPIVVVVFTLIGALTQPVVEAFIQKNAQLLARSIDLIAAFVTLLVTDLVSSNLNISGVSAWILGTLIIWAASLLTALIVGKRLSSGALRDRVLPEYACFVGFTIDCDMAFWPACKLTMCPPE